MNVESFKWKKCPRSLDHIYIVRTDFLRKKETYFFIVKYLVCGRIYFILYLLYFVTLAFFAKKEEHIMAFLELLNNLKNIS